METSAGRLTRTRFVEGLLGWLDANVPALPPDAPERRLMEYIGGALAERHGLPPLGSRRRVTLRDAKRELAERLRESGAEPWEPLTPEQWATYGAGMPFGYDELADLSAEITREAMPRADGRPKIVIGSGMHFCGAMLGALAQSWRR